MKAQLLLATCQLPSRARASCAQESTTRAAGQASILPVHNGVLEILLGTVADRAADHSSVN